MNVKKLNDERNKYRKMADFEFNKLKEIHDQVFYLKENFPLLFDGVAEEYQSDYEEIEDILYNIERQLYFWILFMEK